MRTSPTPRVLPLGLAAGALLLCAALARSADAPPEPAPLEATPVLELTPHDKLFDVDFAGGDGWAVGDFGLVLHSGDGGDTWERQPLETTLALLGVDFLDEERGVAVGQSGTVFYTEDGGGRWARARADFSGRLLSVALRNDGLGIAVGEFGALLRSRDHGRSWQRLEIDWEALDQVEPPHLYDVVFTPPDRITLAGEFGLVLRSADAGASWRVLRRGRQSLFAIAAVGPERLVAVGQEGTLLDSPDGGATWLRRPTGTEANLLNVWLSQHGEGVVTGIRTLLRSRDGGRTWRSVTGSPVSERWYQGIGRAVAAVEEEPARGPDGRPIGGRATFLVTRILIAGAQGSILRLEN